MSRQAQVAGERFENDVRRIARALWPEAVFGGAQIIDERERDGVFETEEAIHLLEITTERTLEKAKQDIQKMVTLAKKLSKARGKLVDCWFVTRDEPTPHQKTFAASRRSGSLPVR